MRLRGHRMNQGTLLCSLVLLVTILCAVQAVAEYRLPDDVVPLEYKLDLLAPPGKISSNKDRMYNGKLWITVECKVDTNVIKLHSKELKISTKGKNQLTVTEKEKQEKLNVHRTEMQQENAHFIIELLKPLEKGKTYVVYLYFEGEWSHGLMEGFHRNNFKDEWGHIRTYAIKKNRFGAHGVFPCFDEPRFRAKFYISIGVRKPHIPITNTPQKQESPFIHPVAEANPNVPGGAPFIMCSLKFCPGKHHGWWKTIASCTYDATFSDKITSSSTRTLDDLLLDDLKTFLNQHMIIQT
ncbi:aminopeptidase N-like [Macrosteles quadrilineatus]|uniref:aminopeptidase N-like n=1 Tax=Macrosteles quadrilineatus TaxID=74068 RepID=UPI0023E0AB57|nr:aminopeptidase N-like [Macrosteles quadrilineatus]